MTEFFQALVDYRATKTETDLFAIAVSFCAAGLAAYLIRATYGLDLSPGFF